MGELQLETLAFTRERMDELGDKISTDYPVVYLLNNKTEVYIGETVAIRNRMKQHAQNPERKKLDSMTVISHEQFNRSAAYNIETNLINFFLGDERYKLQNKSQTAQSVMHNYYNKRFFHETLFEEIWNELRNRDLVTHSKSEIENKDIFKLSPFKQLTTEQMELKDKMIEVCEAHIHDSEPFVFVIKGEAGSGKSVVLSAVFNRIQELSKDKWSSLHGTDNYLLVNHSEMLKTYKKIAGNVKALSKKNFEKPTPFINKRKKLEEKADIVLIDEGHLLLTKPDSFNNFTETNHLEEIIKYSRIVFLVFDEKQVLKMKSYWDEERLAAIIGKGRTEKYQLTNQFRMQAGIDVINWIDRFVEKVILPMPEKDDEYEFKIFASAEEMYTAIQEKDRKAGLARVVSTFDYVHKKDGGTYYIEEDGMKLPWNTTEGSETWAEKPDTIHEAGSIYTVQGFDLNYTGVILGPSVSYDEESDTVRILTEKYKDTEAYRGKDEFEDSSAVKEKIILNSINILMKRGVHGLYIYAADPKLRAKLLSL